MLFDFVDGNMHVTQHFIDNNASDDGESKLVAGKIRQNSHLSRGYLSRGYKAQAQKIQNKFE
jgi:hypothetical protein